MNIKTTINKNILWNILGATVPMLVGLVSIPYILENIGIERLGFLTLTWSFIGYFTIFDFGLGRALTHQIAKLRAKQEVDHIVGIIKFGLFLMIFVGILGTLLMSLLVYIFDITWLDVSEEFYDDVHNATLLSIIIIPVVTLTVGLRGALEGFEEFKEISILRIYLGIANFLLPAFSIYYFGPSLTFIVVWLIIARAVIVVMHVILLNKKFDLGLIFSSRIKIDSKPILHFGMWMTISNIVSPLMVVVDRFIIPSFVGAAFIAFYSIPVDFLLKFLILPAALTTVIFPRITHIFNKDTVQARELFFKSLKIVFLVMAPILLFTSIISYEALKFWLGYSFAENSHMVVKIISLGILFNSLAQVPYMFIQAVGGVKKTAIIHVSEFIFYMPSLLFFVSEYGIVGAAVTWLLRSLIDLLLLLFVSIKYLRSDYFVSSR